MRFHKLAIALCLVCLPCFAADVTVLVKPGVRPFQPGTEDSKDQVFPTIQNAIDHAAEPTNGGRVIIQITPGTYKERVWIPQNRPRVTLVGLGKDPSETIISAGQFAKQAGGTFFTGTVEIYGNEFAADNLTFENTAGNVGQAVAATVQSDKAIFKKCRFLGYQDTLFANWGRQYYVDSYIEGVVDFIFGDAAAVFDHTEIHASGPGYLTAQSRVMKGGPTGYVIVNSKLTTANQGTRKTALGRPWRRYSRVVYLNTSMDEGIQPDGWNDWNRKDLEDTFYAEYGSTGPGGIADGRVKWSHQLTKAQAAAFMPKVFLRGKDGWNPVTAAAKLP